MCGRGHDQSVAHPEQVAEEKGLQRLLELFLPLPPLCAEGRGARMMDEPDVIRTALHDIGGKTEDT